MYTIPDKRSPFAIDVLQGGLETGPGLFLQLSPLGPQLSQCIWSLVGFMGDTSTHEITSKLKVQQESWYSAPVVVMPQLGGATGVFSCVCKRRMVVIPVLFSGGDTVTHCQ